MADSIGDAELITDAELDAAAERGRIAEETEPRARSARYDRKSGRIVVELKNDCTFAFPARMAQGLEHAGDDDLAEVEVIMNGYGLHWETLNEDHAIPALLTGIFGSRKYMARVAGRAKSPAKAAAARANGKKGGRPRKIAVAKIVKPLPVVSASRRSSAAGKVPAATMPRRTSR